jgi:hypothetical protein
MTEYVIFKLFDKEDLTYPVFISFIKHSKDCLLNWVENERYKLKIWYYGFTDKFSRSFILLMNHSKRLGIRSMEIKKGEIPEIADRVRELSKKFRAINTWSSEEIEKMFTQRINHLRKILKDKLKYQERISVLKNEEDANLEDLERKEKQNEERIAEIQKAITTQENFVPKERPPKKEETGKPEEPETHEKSSSKKQKPITNDKGPDWEKEVPIDSKPKKTNLKKPKNVTDEDEIELKPKKNKTLPEQLEKVKVSTKPKKDKMKQEEPVKTPVETLSKAGTEPKRYVPPALRKKVV